MDRKWMFANRLSNEYENGVKEFIAFAVEHATDCNSIICPCLDCCHSRRVNVVELEEHLLRFGIDESYTCWTKHGERRHESSNLEANVSHTLNVDAETNAYEGDRVEEIVNMVEEDFRECPQMFDRFLYDQVLLPNHLAERFCFLSPVKLSIYESKQSQYISDALSANDNPNRIFFAPYNCGGHWVLIVINASDASITYYDSMRGDPRTYTAMKNLFDSGLMTYRAQREHVLPKMKSNTINWSSVKCPRQRNDVDCGYYVLRYMRSLILSELPQPLDKDTYDLSCNFFSQDQVDEIREEWSSYVLHNFILNK